MNITILLVSWSFGIIAAFSLLRFMMQLARVNVHNSIVQFVCRVTDVYCQPVRNILPQTGQVDITSLLMTFLIQLLSLVTLADLLASSGPSLYTLVIWAFLASIGLCLRIYFIALILVVIFSWVRPQGSQAIMELSGQIINPLLKPLHRFIPPVGGLDFSPMILFFFIYMLQNVWRSVAVSMGMPFQLIFGA